ncbi:MSC_0882 family membrane protein [Mycoplasma crocodyli]|uniref:Uncharacterized protein n=1 Tax=Mycoplasma crocodyli (strain ATCC 51981 / MP145) TaxID=512564 RepID=D5E4L3_MYCCM|nr:hypothetical protein [Mycoplasma crocodyli]ADE19569.1 conserved hypothetical protein [Mycoplasma crocodyli MP145]
MNFRPINDNTQGINVIQNNSLDRTIRSESNLKSDPEGQLSPRAYRIIQRERAIKGISSLIWGSALFLSSLILLVLALIFTNTVKIPFLDAYTNQKTSANVIGYYILLLIFIIVSFSFMIRNIIDFTSWKNTIKRLRESYDRGDASANVMFHSTYRKLTLKTIKTMWVYINILTFYGFFALVIFGLKYIKIHTESEIFALKLDMELILQKAFGNVNVFTIINVIILISATAVFVAVNLIDKKRIIDLQDFLGEKTHEIMESITISKEKLNKAFLRVYLVCVGIFIVLPIFLLMLAIYRMIKKKKVGK